MVFLSPLFKKQSKCSTLWTYTVATTHAYHSAQSATSSRTGNKEKGQKTLQSLCKLVHSWVSSIIGNSRVHSVRDYNSRGTQNTAFPPLSLRDLITLWFIFYNTLIGRGLETKKANGYEMLSHYFIQLDYNESGLTGTEFAAVKLAASLTQVDAYRPHMHDGHTQLDS